MAVRRTWGRSFLLDWGEGCRAGGRYGEEEGASRVSGDILSSQTLGACGAGTFGRRSEHTPGIGTS